MILAGLLSARIASGMDLQTGNFLLVSGNVLVQVDRTGDVVDGAFLSGLSASDVSDVALSPGADILVSGGGYYSPAIIYRINPDGMVLNSNASPVFFYSFAVTPNGDLLLGDRLTIFRVDSAFNFLDAFPVPPAPGSAPSINGISVDQNGSIYVAVWSQNGQDSVIHRMDAEGNVRDTLGPYDFEIHGLAVDTNRHIFYAKEGRDVSGFPLPSEIVELDENGLEIRTFQAPFQVDGMTLINPDPRPKLLIGHAQDDVTIRWTTNSAGYQLQAASISSLQNWSMVSSNPVVADRFFTVTLPAAHSGRIYRLMKTP